jgi:hypothetical protein
MQLPISRFTRRAAALSVALALAVPGIALADLNELQKLSPTANPGALAGHTVAVNGGVAVVGAPDDSGGGSCVAGAGAAYVYVLSGGIWMAQQTLCAADGVAGDQFGETVSVTNGNIAVGAPARNGNTGAVYVFHTDDNLTWNPLVTLTDGAPPNGNLGFSVSIQGFTVAAGAPHASVGNRTNTGVTLVYTSNDSGATWTRTTFRANGGQARTGSLFGSSVSLSGSTILVGAPGYHTGNKQNSGNVFVFVNNGSIWTQQANIRPANVANAVTGTGVSLFQNTAAFGAPGNQRVYIYTRTGTSWSNTSTINGGVSGFGHSVSIQGSPAFSFLAVGSPADNSGGGRAFEFGSNGGPYSQLNELIATDNAGGDAFGNSVGLDAGQIFVGAPNQATFGAAYAFKFQNPSVTKITGFSADPSLTGVPYTVTVTVTDGSGNNDTPTGSVHLDDSNGGSCDALLALDPDLGNTDGHAIGSCALTSNFFGTLTMNASYGGDANFSASGDSTSHDVTGNHFVFNPATPANQLQGTEANGIVVELRDGADNLVASDSITQVTVLVNDTCGGQTSLGTVTLTNGVADFTGLGPKFYTATSGGALTMNAQQEPFNVLTSPSSATSGSFDVDTNPDIVFADGFEDCRL